MPHVADITDYFDRFAPPTLAEEWDNVGLLMGDRRAPIERVMTCLTITPDSAAEAVEERADLIVAHHPLPFRPLKRITTDDHDGRLLWQLSRSGVAIYSPHTAFDSASEGINARLAAGLGLTEAKALVPNGEGGGAGRFGKLARPMPMKSVIDQVKQFLNVTNVQFVGTLQRPLAKIAVACGSAGEFLPHAVAAGCECLVTGEMRFHTCLEAESAGIALVLAGHFATERFAVEELADLLATEFPDLRIWASRRERDPLQSA